MDEGKEFQHCTKKDILGPCELEDPDPITPIARDSPHRIRSLHIPAANRTQQLVEAVSILLAATDPEIVRKVVAGATGT